MAQIIFLTGINCPEIFFGNFSPLEMAEVNREDHKEQLLK